MSATTIKLEGSILSALRGLQRPGTTLTALVRELLEAEIRRRRMAQAAADYTAFLSEHPDEAEELDTWARAPLERASRKRGTRKRA